MPNDGAREYARWIVSFDAPVDRTDDEIRAALEALGARNVRIEGR